MNTSLRFDAGADFNAEPLSDDGERIFRRRWRDTAGDNKPGSVLTVELTSQRPTPHGLDRLTREYALKDELDQAWALQPQELVRERGRILLVLNDPGGVSLNRLLGAPMEISRFLLLAIAASSALSRLHERDLIHKDIKPTNIWVNSTTSQVWLTGFGIASRIPRERQSPEPPEFIAGTLPYMAPEQTGRMNRSIDSRCDLYSLGVTFYEMLTGSLPFTASEAMEWVHCHIARQPPSPDQLVADMPAPLSAIVLKLLCKTADERYQTAAGLEADLRRCLTEWESRKRIDAFSLGSRDKPERLLISEKLYGREQQIGSLLAAFERVVHDGTPELILIAGYSGIGKSSVVNELHRVLVPPRGFFAAGKFDQYKRDIPYVTLAHALRTLVRQILLSNEAEVDRWRNALLEAVEPNGQLIVSIVPELELIIGRQPPVPDLSPRDAQNRFRSAFQRFLGVFAKPEHPLALFLDDLQWVDTETLDLIEDLVTHAEVRHLLLIGAYRNNEVSRAHPLLYRLDAIRKTGALAREIELLPLGLADISQLIADAMFCAPEHASPLAELIYEKTEGNPFFAIQFFTALAEERLLVFDPTTRAWKWDVQRIRAKNYTDNVVDLMAAKLKRLPPASQQALKQLACLGNVAPTTTLSLIHGTTEDALHATLWAAVRAGLIFRADSTYKFLHDRIQQAAYTLIADSDRPDLHLTIGRLLLANSTEEQLAEHLFDVANQFIRGATRLVDPQEKERVALIHLRVGRRAKASAAYTSGCAYLTAGMALMDSNALDNPSQHDLAFGLHLERAECELLSGNFDEAERLLLHLIERGASRIDKANAYGLKIHLHIIKSEKAQGVTAALECLRLFGIDMSPHPTRDEVHAEYEIVWRNLGERTIESLIDLPLMTDPETHAIMRVLAFLTGPSLYTDIDLYYWHFCKMVNLSLTYGISDAAAFGYTGFGVMLCLPFRRYAEGYRFAKLACDLVEKHGFAAYKAKVYLDMEMVALWTKPIEVGIELARDTLSAGAEVGDIAFACYGCIHLLTNLLVMGTHLDEVWRESEICLDFVRRAKYLDAADVIICQQQLVKTLRGQTASFSTFSDDMFDEKRFEDRLTDDRMTPLISRYWILKVQSRFMSADYRSALEAAERAREWLWSSEAFLQSLDYHYYAALTVAACYQDGSAAERKRWRELLADHREQLREWAENYPPTFADKHALVAAEIARLEGRDADAMCLYERAIRSAKQNGFVQNEGLAYEVAGRFYSARDFESIANAYLVNARSCYLRWGAGGKVRQLDRMYPHLAASDTHGPAVTIGSSVHQFDAATVVKASQTLSSEIVFSKLIERLMEIALENAGADRGLLILPLEEDYLVCAEARARGDRFDVQLCNQLISESACPESLLRYVIRTHERVILDDASKPNLFSADDYLRGRRVKSILCVPLIKQGRIAGLLYLENTLTSYAFSPDRVMILGLLASQAAISLEITRLYADLQEREARIRRLVEANVAGIFVWDFDGRILEANDSFLRMVEYDRDDLIAKRLRWTELTPPEWLERDEQLWIPELKKLGRLQPFEKEYFRKDGTRVPVLVGTATLEGRSEGVAFVLDLSDRKRAEAEARDSERRYREVLMELAHANRVTTMGQLAASIAHEVNQPIAAVVSNGNAALRWLGNTPLDLEEARRALEGVVRNASRAGKVVGRIRDLVKKAPPRTGSFDINTAIAEVIELTHGEALKNNVSVRSALTENPLLVEGDRVELQQVVLNLSINAIEAMAGVSEGPRELLIKTTQADTHEILVTVQDTGTGLDPGDAARIFESFYTTKASGMGMGLSICRSIIEMYGGRIWTTANVPRGANFHFSLRKHRDQAS